MIIRTILTKINVHPLFILLGLFCLITGLFKHYLILLVLIIGHESGHLFMAALFKWPLTKINLYPFGGQLNFAVPLNHSLKAELYIVLAGPIMQCLIYLSCYLLAKHQLLLPTTFTIIKNYHYSLLLFNLLPILPLDGARLINIIYNYFFSFKTAHLLLIYTSMLSLLIIIPLLLHYNFNFNLYLLVFILIYKTKRAYQHHNYLYSLFLTERYLYRFAFPRLKIIRGNYLRKMMLNKKHLFHYQKQYFTEKQVLNKYFEPKN